MSVKVNVVPVKSCANRDAARLNWKPSVKGIFPFIELPHRTGSVKAMSRTKSCDLIIRNNGTILKP